MTREEAIKVLKNPPRVYDEDMWTALGMAIDALSADAVQVVRCKDCKRRWTDGCKMWDTEWVTVDEGDGYQEDDYVVHDYTADDGYCSYGERKSGEDK